MNLEFESWISDPKELRKIRSELNFEIVRQFKDAGIRFAVPVQTIRLDQSSDEVARNIKDKLS